MIFKINKDKENSKSQRTSLILSSNPSNIESIHKPHNSFHSTLAPNQKILKFCRNSYNPAQNSHINAQHQHSVIQSTNSDHRRLSCTNDNMQFDGPTTICAKRISLCDNRQKNNNKICRSANNYYEKMSILQQSNFDRLKLEARKLEEQESFCALYRWKPGQNGNKKTAIHEGFEYSNENSNLLLSSFRKSKKPNMRKIIKGRPEIKRLLQQNRDKIITQKKKQRVNNVNFASKNIQEQIFVVQSYARSRSGQQNPSSSQQTLQSQMYTENILTHHVSQSQSTKHQHQNQLQHQFIDRKQNLLSSMQTFQNNIISRDPVTITSNPTGNKSRRRYQIHQKKSYENAYRYKDGESICGNIIDLGNYNTEVTTIASSVDQSVFESTKAPTAQNTIYARPIQFHKKARSNTHTNTIKRKDKKFQDPNKSISKQQYSQTQNKTKKTNQYKQQHPELHPQQHLNIN